MARTPLAVAAKKVRMPGKKVKQEALDRVLSKKKSKHVEEPEPESKEKKHRRKSSTAIKYVVAQLQKGELEVIPRTAAYDLVKFYAARLTPNNVRVSEGALDAVIARVTEVATQRARKMAAMLDYAGECTLNTRVIEQCSA